MYYRVAIQVAPSSTWQWRSTVLTSLHALFGFLRLYRSFPQDRLRVFSCSVREGLNEMLAQENNGGASRSVTAEHFLHERKIHSGGMRQGASGGRTRENLARGFIALTTTPSLGEKSPLEQPRSDWSTSSLESRWFEAELGARGDHDLPNLSNLETIAPETETLAKYGFTADEIGSLLWLQRWYQNGGSDRVQVVRHWEFLKLLVMSGKLEV